MIIFDYYDIGLDGKVKNKSMIKRLGIGKVNKNIILEEFVTEKSLKGYLWNKAIKRKYYKDIKFNTEIKVGEDGLMLTDILLMINTIVYIPKANYYYVRRATSLVNQADLKDTISLFQIAKYRYNLYKKYINNLSIYRPIKYCYEVLRQSYISKENTLEFETFIKNNIMIILRDTEIDFNTKKQCLLVYFGLARAYNIWKYGKK